MQTMRTVFFGILGIVAATAAYAQTPGPGPADGPLGVGGRTVTVGPQQTPSQATPLFRIGNLPVGIWAPVPPPYDAMANRNGAANPLP